MSYDYGELQILCHTPTPSIFVQYIVSEKRKDIISDCFHAYSGFLSSTHILHRTTFHLRYSVSFLQPAVTWSIFFHLLYYSSYAAITVDINNHGEDAFKPEVYGDTIILERRITESTSSTVLKDQHGNSTCSTSSLPDCWSCSSIASGVSWVKLLAPIYQFLVMFSF